MANELKNRLWVLDFTMECVSDNMSNITCKRELSWNGCFPQCLYRYVYWRNIYTKTGWLSDSATKGIEHARLISISQNTVLVLWVSQCLHRFSLWMFWIKSGCCLVDLGNESAVCVVLDEGVRQPNFSQNFTPVYRSLRGSWRWLQFPFRKLRMNIILINRAARKQGIWMCIWTDKENTGKLPKTAKWLREYTTRKNW